jgi:hypothetical protein
MADYTCTFTYDDTGAVVLTWAPHKPTTMHPCHVGDTITFTSPGIDTDADFYQDTPFEAAAGAKKYHVKKGGYHKPAAIKERARGRDFKFLCEPSGEVIPGAGGDVPVGN